MLKWFTSRIKRQPRWTFATVRAVSVDTLASDTKFRVQHTLIHIPTCSSIQLGTKTNDYFNKANELEQPKTSLKVSFNKGLWRS